MLLYMEKAGFDRWKRLEIKKPVDKSVETVDNFMHPEGVEKYRKIQNLRKKGIFPQIPSTCQNAQSAAECLGKCRKMENFTGTKMRNHCNNLTKMGENLSFSTESEYRNE